MSSYYTLATDQILALQSPLSSFEIYTAFHAPVGFTQASQDIQTNNGTVVLPPATDLLANHRAPYVPSPLFGSNRIGFVGEALFFDGSRSTQRSGLLAWGHIWTITGPATTTYTATPGAFDARVPYSTNTGNQQCAITWSVSGNYTVSLTVSDRYGNSFTGTRQVAIFADRQHGLPGIIQIGSVTGSSTQGWTCQLTTVSNSPGFINPDALPVGFYLPVTLIVEEHHLPSIAQTSTRTIGQYGDWNPGQPYNDPRILFSGYVVSGTVHQDDQYDTISFSCQTPDLILQEANILTIGFYNATWQNKDAQGRWSTLQESTPKSDQLIADMTAEDVYRALLIDHVTFATYHDVIVWNRYLVDPVLPTNSTALTYTGLTANQGSLWSALQTIAQNEYAEMCCERDGTFRIGPPVQYIGTESWGWLRNAPITQSSGAVDLTGALNTPVWPPSLRTDIGPGTSVNPAYPLGAGTVPPNWGPHIVVGNLWNIYNLRTEFFSDIVSSNNIYGFYNYSPPQPCWVPFVSIIWGPLAVAQPHTIALAPLRDPSQAVVLPVVCHFSDVPEWDGSTDISVTPFSIDIDEQYAKRSSFIKLIAYRLQHDQAWSSSYPLGVYDVTGAMVYRLPVGNFALQDNLLLPDMTNGTAVQIGWDYLWNLARLVYFAQNARYTVTLQYGQNNVLNLHDLVFVTRQHTHEGPTFSQKLFMVQQITYAIDLTQRTWHTTLTGQEITSSDPAFATSVIPPWPPPVC